MNDLTNSSLYERRGPLGWFFNDIEEAAIRRAKKGAVVFMTTFGQVPQPHSDDIIIKLEQHGCSTDKQAQ